MRDINSKGNLNIDTVVDNSINLQSNNQEYPLLIQCDNDTLYKERKFRKERLKAEKEKKFIPSTIKALFLAFIIFIVLLLINKLMPKLFGDNTLAILLTIPSAIWAIMAIVLYFVPNKYEKRHLQALQEITDLLRERGVE